MKQAMRIQAQEAKLGDEIAGEVINTININGASGVMITTVGERAYQYDLKKEIAILRECDSVDQQSAYEYIVSPSMWQTWIFEG